MAYLLAVPKDTMIIILLAAFLSVTEAGASLNQDSRFWRALGISIHEAETKEGLLAPRIYFQQV